MVSTLSSRECLKYWPGWFTDEDSRIHHYGVTEDDSLAHFDLGFKFYDLTDNVHGVLGQTYRTN
jgi:hypothetical protein